MTQTTGRRWRYRPSVPLQHRTSDCGYVCIVAMLAIQGVVATTDEVIAVMGDTTRGLTLRQLRDGFRQLAVQSEVVAFDKSRIGSIPTPCVALLTEGHYVVVTGIRGEKAEVFYPEFGWTTTPLKKLLRALTGYAVTAAAEDSAETVRILQPRQPPSVGDIGRPVLMAYRTGVGIRSLAASVAAQIATLSLPLLTAGTVDRLATAAKAAPASTIMLVFLLVSVMSSILGALGTYASYFVDVAVTRAISGRLVDNLAARAPAWFEARPPATLSNQFYTVQAEKEFFTQLPIEVSRIVVTIAFALFAITGLSWQLLLPGLASLCLSIWIDNYFTQRGRHLAFSAEIAQMRRSHMARELFPLIPRLTRLGGMKGVRAKFLRQVQQAAVSDLQSKALQTVHSSMGAAVKHFEQLAFIAISAYLLNQESYSLGLFVAAGVYRDQLMGGIKSIFTLHQRWKYLEPGRRDTADFMNEQTASPPLENQVVSQGEIVASGLGFAYGELEASVLSNIDFRVPPGSLVVIKGPSGVGKSTLLKLMCGLLRPSAGTLTIDGAAAERIAGGVGYVSQTEALLSGSIRHNILAFRRGISDAEVWDALRLVGLFEFVNSLPMRLQTIVGEGVPGMSGGQRQRLMLARAVVGRPRLLVLDEATANLDPALEEQVIQNLRSLDATVVFVTHRQEVWKHADHTIDLCAPSILPPVPHPLADASALKNHSELPVD